MSHDPNKASRRQGGQPKTVRATNKVLYETPVEVVVLLILAMGVDQDIDVEENHDS